MKRTTACIAVALSLGIACDAKAGVDQRDLVVISTMPIAPRGGVLLARLGSTDETIGWPSTALIRVQDSAGEEIELSGHIGWMEQRPHAENRAWSWSGSTLHIRPIEPGDDTATIPPGDGSTGPYLLVELPPDGEGSLRIGRQDIDVRWMDLPADMPSLNFAGVIISPAVVMEASDAPDHPAANDPFAWWRWNLLANRLGRRPPPPPDENEVTRLLAEHITQLWRIGLTRLSIGSRGVASRCRDLLTETCRDGDVTFAAWINDSLAISELLSIMFDVPEQDRMVTMALSWADRQVPVVAWVEQAFGEQVRLSIGNPDTRPQLAELIWSERGTVPIGMHLKPNSVTQVTVDRPPSDMVARLYPDLDPTGIEQLNLVVHNHVMSITFSRESIPVQPPGALLGPFNAPLTLAAARSQAPAPVPVNRTTWCQLRHINGKWELFIECQRPSRVIGRELAGSYMRSLETLRGIEAITILIGPPRHERAPSNYGICIPERGAPMIIVGARDEAAGVHIRSYEDRWLARFVIPGNWLPVEGEPLLLSMIRTHADNQDFETAPNACLPWSMRPDPVQLNLEEWEGGGARIMPLPSGRRINNP